MADKCWRNMIIINIRSYTFTFAIKFAPYVIIYIKLLVNKSSLTKEVMKGFPDDIPRKVIVGRKD